MYICREQNVKRMKNILIVLFIILLNILNPQYLLARDLKFNRLTAENGLPYSTANVMLQDDNGFQIGRAHV